MDEIEPVVQAYGARAVRVSVQRLPARSRVADSIKQRSLASHDSGFWTGACGSALALEAQVGAVADLRILQLPQLPVALRRR